MKYAIDASVLIDHLRKYAPAVDLIDRLITEDATFVSSFVVRTEVLAGMRRGEEDRTTALLDLVEWESIGEDESDAAGALGRRHIPGNLGIDTPDLFLAEAANRHGAEVLTTNVKHFKDMFPEIAAPYSY